MLNPVFSFYTKYFRVPNLAFFLLFYKKQFIDGYSNPCKPELAVEP